MKISSNLKLGYTTGGSSRGARRRGLAGSGRIRCQHSACLSRKQSFCAFSKNIDNHSFDYFPRNTCRIKNTFRVGSERRAEHLGKVGQDWVPTELSAQETKGFRSLQGIEETCLQPTSRSTNKQNPMSTEGVTKSAVDHCFISGLSPGHKARLVIGCQTMEQHLFVSFNPFHARHVRGPKNKNKRIPIYTDGETKPLVKNWIIICLSTCGKAFFLVGCRPIERRFFGLL